MTQEKIKRTLWYEEQGERKELLQEDLFERPESLVILGEAGMGKSDLLRWIADNSTYASCTARQLINRYNPLTLLGDAKVIVIDAIDEVRSKNDGDAIDLVLRKLGEINYPRFLLSCRVADWRNATGVESFREQYNNVPLVLHLEPFNDSDVTKFLSDILDAVTATNVIEHYNSKGLNKLLGNPHTLELIANLAKVGALPESKSELFEKTVENLQKEHNESHAENQLGSEVGLDAAGAAFAGLILTSSEAIVRKAAENVAEGELLLADASQLPSGKDISLMLSSRLFRGVGVDRFSYWHRSIGEYLGARWLAKRANTKRKRRRLLAMFQSYGVVPVSLRGIHAWLAIDPELADDVISADPMGFVEYGDADALNVTQARSLVGALKLLAQEHPHFVGWDDYNLRGIAHTDLAVELREIIFGTQSPFTLRLLILRAIKETNIVLSFADDLRVLMLDKNSFFSIRSAAAEALIYSNNDKNWSDDIRSLFTIDDEWSARLAIETVNKIGYDPFDDNLLADLVITYSKEENPTIGVLMLFEKYIPLSRISGVLDCLSLCTKNFGEDDQYPGRDHLTDFTYHLIVRFVSSCDIAPEKLWSWLKPLRTSFGYQREVREQLDTYIVNNHILRGAIQRMVLLEEESDHNIWQRSWRLQERSKGLQPSSSEDIIKLLETLDSSNSNDQRWREIVDLFHHDGEIGSDIRKVAQPFALHSPESITWLINLPQPKVYEWEKEQEERLRIQREEREVLVETRRMDFLKNINDVRAGSYGWILNLAKVYLNLFSDIDRNLPAHERITSWAGEEINISAQMGFESFLLQKPPKPTATDLAESFAEGRGWEASYIIVAAFAERFRKGISLDDLSDERLMAVFFELINSGIDQYAGLQGLKEFIRLEIHKRGRWHDAARLYCEPQLLIRRENVRELHIFMRDDTHENLLLELAIEWLERFPEMPFHPENELISRLLRSKRFHELSPILSGRIILNDDERRRNWTAVGLLVEFQQTVMRVQSIPIEPELIWHIRQRSSLGDGTSVALGSELIEWIISNFRECWPVCNHPRGVTTGDTNPWDASQYLSHLIGLLGSNSSVDAIAALKRLRDAPVDSYTETIKSSFAEQNRICVEASYTPPSLNEIAAIIENLPPENISDLQKFMLEELEVVQDKIRSDDVDSWRGFYDDNNVPYKEERCRDHLLTLLRIASEGISLNPESHVASDKEVDITCSVGRLRLPIEIKGQWHKDLWHAADSQLDRLYTKDWQAEKRGIYLVLWFGEQQSNNKKLKTPGRGKVRPQSPIELRDMLNAGSASAIEKRVAIYVLDLSR